ncbi:hypothetical protein [Clostridium sp. CF012]|uniref:hypothetical protein n=1 Tax=Clostridium sp. CF012 TaxID=2843319 RepID=UPI001C0BEBE5|nr:hypothetical protein [Clostridium sp. CF012]MBU3146693.1 hypothetical protein [Clostridium sp. CF012]
MLKKLDPIIFMFVPTIIGYFSNVLFTPALPALSIFLFYILPIFMLYFWYWVGGKFAQKNIKAFPSILIGNSLGIVSLIIYFWQFFIVLGGQRVVPSTELSQAFSASLGMYIVRFANLFKFQSYGTTVTVGQVLGLILMIIIFTAGYYFNKRKIELYS